MGATTRRSPVSPAPTTVLAPPITVEPVLAVRTAHTPLPNPGCTCPWDYPPDDPEDHEEGCPVRREAQGRRSLDLRRFLDSTWRGRAACRDEPDDSLFLSDKTLAQKAPDSPSIALAMSICAGCPVRRECLAEAMPRTIRIERADGTPVFVRPVMVGVWGGTTEVERVQALAIAGTPEAAVELLESTFDKRLRTRLRATRKNGCAAGGRRQRLHTVLREARRKTA